MSTKKIKTVTQAEPEKAPETRYPKATLLKAARWKDRSDLLNAILEDGRSYTIDEVDHAINEYFNKEV